MARRRLDRRNASTPFAAALIAIAALGCGQPAGTTAPATAGPTSAAPTSTAAPVGTPSAALLQLAEEACLATEWADCVAKVVNAAQTVPGSIVAICDFGNQTGDVLVIDAESEAQAECSAKGGTATTRVVGVLTLP